MNASRLAMALALTASLAGCYTVTVNMDAPDTPKGAVVGHFRDEIKMHHLVAGLVTLNDPHVQTVIKQEIERADGKYARNVKLTHQHVFFDYLLTFISSGIYSPTTLVIEGDVVK